MKLHELFPDASVSDYQLYLEGSITKVQHSDWKTPKWCSLLGFNDGRVLLRPLNKTYQKVLQLYQNEIEVDPAFPECGFYPFRKSVCFVQRTIIRQNKKGICNKTLSILNLSDSFIQCARNMLAHKGYALTKKMYESINVPSFETQIKEILLGEPQFRFTPFSNALKQIEKTTMFARALAPMFAVSSGVYPNQDIALWYQDAVIGYVKNEKPKPTIIIEEPMFLQETYDVLGEVANVWAV